MTYRLTAVCLSAFAAAVATYFVRALFLQDGAIVKLRSISELVAHDLDGNAISTLRNSLAIAGLAALLIYVVTESILSSPRRPWQLVSFGLMYGFDPVVRILALRSAVQWLEPWLLRGAGASVWGGVIPAVALAFTYAPLYAIARAWELKQERVQRERYLGFMYSSLQPSLRRAPLLLSVLVLICITDPWVFRIVTLGKQQYWGNLILSHAFGSFRPEVAARLCLLTVGVVAVCFVLLLTVRAAWEHWFSRLNPAPAGRRPRRHMISSASAMLALIWGVGTPVWIVVEALTNDLRGTEQSVSHILTLSLVLCGCAAMLSVAAATLLLLTVLRFRQMAFVASVCAAFLVICPELAFVLIANKVTSVGLAAPGILWSLFWIVGYTGPLSFLLLHAFAHVKSRQLLPLLGRAAVTSVLSGGRLVYLAFRRELWLLVLLVTWLVLEDVMLLNFALGPEGTIASTVYAGAGRGMRTNVAWLSGAGAVVKLSIVALGLALSSSWRMEWLKRLRF